jgi:hypothetical protein
MHYATPPIQTQLLHFQSSIANIQYILRNNQIYLIQLGNVIVKLPWLWYS